MQFVNILAIAVALAMDAFAVAVATGVSLKHVSFRQTFRLSWHFGLFQAIMPVIGWSAGLTIRSFIEQYDHWVAFGLLAFVGGHMIKEAFQPETEKIQKKDPTKGWSLVMLSVATSIDALAVGFSMSMLNIFYCVSCSDYRSHCLTLYHHRFTYRENDRFQFTFEPICRSDWRDCSVYYWSKNSL